MSKYVIPLGFVLIMLLGIHCKQEGKGFSLPPGDESQGKVAIQKFHCTDCHDIKGLEWTGGDATVKIPLGGAVSKAKTYGELVTSVINPSHKIASNYEQPVRNPDGSSLMRSYNDVMTVQELVDIVAFLQSVYEIERPTNEFYPYN